MRFITTKLLTLCALFCMALGAVAQTTPLPYKNGFEVDAENSQWQFVGNDASATNKWVIGQAVKQAGLKSLYVSPDGTAKGYNDNTTQIVTMAYRSFNLPTDGTYSFFMDYRHQGAQNSDSLFVCWVDDPTITIPATTGGTLPSWVRTKAKVVDRALYSNQRNLSFSVCGGEGRLVIVWKRGNQATTGTIKNSEIYIDNIQINKNLDYNYFTGFDDNDETAGWTLYGDAYNTNKWVFGNAINLTNSRALYISYNGQSYAYDGTKQGIVSAVKEFTLPAGEYYNIEFDYLVGGDNQDYMYVCWIDNVMDTTFDMWNSNNLFIDPIIQNSAKPTAGYKYKSSPTWTHASFQVEGKGFPVKLAFVWVNNNQKATLPSPVIDNLLIKKGVRNVGGAEILPAACATPEITEVLSTGGGIKVTWNDDQTSTYELAYRNTYDTIGGLFRSVMNVRSPYMIENLEKGAYTVFLRKFCSDTRTICGTTVPDTSAWAVNTQNVVLTGDGCINYGDLNNRETVTPTYGTWSGTAAEQAFQNVGVQAGRHTLVTKPYYDPNTINPSSDNPGLYTIPYGELATVKLGNDNSNRECEGLIYKLHVDPSYVLLVMRYAVVLEDPNHQPSEQPRFRLELLDNAGNIIDPTCGSLNFVVGQNTQNWNKVTQGYKTIYWKDWTTIGLNLEEYAGQDVKIRVSTWDCSLGAHFGYAYFMLDCASKQFQGFSCSTDDIDTIFAPEGFAYCWYKKYNPDGTLATYDPNNCLSTERGFAPTSMADTNTYVCRSRLITEQGVREECFFEISSRLAPRLTEARYAYRLAPQNCVNWVSLMDSSIIHIGSLNSGDTEFPSGRKWIIRENNERGRVHSVRFEKDPMVEFPNEGGTFHITLISILDGTGLCNDTAKFTINVPRIGTVTKEQKITTCRENVPFVWRGKNLSVDGIYRDSVRIQSTGCDSVFILDFKVADKIEVEESDTICQGEQKHWEGDIYTETGTYTKNYISQVGCDSIMKLHLQVNPVMKMSIRPLDLPICADDASFTINYANAGGSEPTKYVLEFTRGSAFSTEDGEYEVEDGSTQIVVPIPVDIRPDKYSVNIKFRDEKYGCPGSIIDVPFNVNYKSATIEQNWGDVVAVLNDSYNGGYNLTRYQWYKNGTPIEGETKSYLYVPAGLEIGAEYNVELTRVGEDYAIFTCPIVAKPYTANATPNFVGGASQVRVFDIDEAADVYIYSTTGMLISHQRITPESPEYVAPQASGIYVVRFVMDSGITRNMKLVVAQ